MGQIKKYKRGDLVYCDILKIASGDWEVAIEGGRLLDLQNSVTSWPRVLSVVLDARPTLKVVKIYAIALNKCIRSPYDCLITLEGEQNEYNKKCHGKIYGEKDQKSS
tara:strand:- start:1997 stop:2317 length:321 start_codon:yes stop_codon:yes gene_type:complete